MFSTIISNQLNSHVFLNNALDSLDNYISANNLGFSAESVIVYITDGYLCNLDDNLTIEQHIKKALKTIPSNLSRLKLASADTNFVYEVLSCPYSFLDGLFPASIVEQVHTTKREDMFFSIDEIINRLKQNLNVNHAMAKTLLARVCGMKTGNELQRFANDMENYMFTWIGLLWMINIPKSLFVNCLDKALEILPEFTEYTSVNTRYENDQIVAMLALKLPSEFQFIIQFSEISSSDDEIGELYQEVSRKYVGYFDERKSNAFYQRLYNFSVSEPCEDQKSLAMKKIIIKSIFCECLTSALTGTLLDACRDILGRCREEVITADEIEYKYYLYLLRGSALFSNDHQSKSHKERMLLICNEYEPTFESDPGLGMLRGFL